MGKKTDSGSLPAKQRRTKKQRLCIACRKCCQELGVFTLNAFYEDPPEDVIHFYQTRGCSITPHESGLLYLSIKMPCPHLTDDGCAIYEDRPQICRKYSGLEEFGDACLWAGLKKQEQ
ncbi:MAG: YkgJ family cysteine cluster protein [Nitrospiraceae bacterium]|nr:YkgJ family cysteine cluster protein [Nitrospiraceae bacterium]